MNVPMLGIGGAFNTAGPRFTWGEFARLLGVDEVVWVPSTDLEAAGVLEQLPLYVPDDGPWGWVMDLSNEKARAAGFMLSDPARTQRCGFPSTPLRPRGSWRSGWSHG